MKQLFAAALLLVGSGCAMFPDPNREALAERRSLSRQIAGLQAKKGLTADEQATLSKLSTVVSSGKPFDGHKVAQMLTGIEQARDNREVIAAGEELQKARREKYLFSHPKTAPAMREAITKGKVLVGMSDNEVVASWGEPLRRTRAAQGSGEQWFFGGNIYLYMENRKVVSFKGSR